MNNKNKGIIFITLSALSFSFMSLFIQLSGDLPSIQKAFFRNIVAVFVALIIIKREKSGFKFKKENLKFFLLRSIAGLGGVVLNFYAIDNMLLSDATIILKLSPFFVILFSFFFLKEKIKLWQGLSIVVAFIGSVFIINPDLIIGLFTGNIGTSMNSFDFPALVALAGAMCAGIAYTTIRKLTSLGERSSFIVFFFSMFSTIALLPFFIFDYHPMTLIQFFYLIGAGVSAGFGQITVTMAYANAPGKDISIYDYSQIIFSAILGMIIFQQFPEAISLIGYFIIMSAAIFMFLKGKKEK